MTWLKLVAGDNVSGKKLRRINLSQVVAYFENQSGGSTLLTPAVRDGDAIRYFVTETPEEIDAMLGLEAGGDDHETVGLR